MALTLKMEKLFIISTIFFLLASCNSIDTGHSKPSLLSHLINVTENEKKGVDEILEYYGGKCLYSVGLNYSTSEPNVKYFELEVFDSELINASKERSDITLSNIAFLFYKNLRNDNHSYQEIHSIIKTPIKEVKETYRIEDLETVFKNSNSLNKYIELIASKQYDELISNTNSTQIIENRDNVVNGLIKADSIFGDMNKEEPFLLSGFKLNENSVRYYGIQLRNKNNCELRIDIDTEDNDQNLIAFEYEIE